MLDGTMAGCNIALFCSCASKTYNLDSVSAGVVLGDIPIVSPMLNPFREAHIVI